MIPPGIKKFKYSPNDKFFDDGNVLCSFSKYQFDKFAVTNDDVISDLFSSDSGSAESSDFFPRCSSSAAAAAGIVRCGEFACDQTFANEFAYAAHYRNCHKFACSQCKSCKFPNEFLLNLHLEEWHDPFFELKFLKKREKTFRCLSEKCQEKFESFEDRKDHVIRVHKYPSNFRFVDKKRTKDGSENADKSENFKTTASPIGYPLPETWVDPKNCWEQDPVVLERREKDLAKGYNSNVYKKYISAIKKKDRIKGVHPKTPNKYLKVPRRSWDTQVRVWRRLLYYAADMEVPSDVSSLNSTNCSETASEKDLSELKLENISDDEHCGDDDGNTKTLKASESCVTVDGPTDFAILTTVT